MAHETIVGGLYAIREKDGLYSITKVLALDDFAVHLRIYANRFKDLPTQVRSSELSLGRCAEPAGFAIGHFPLSIEAFEFEKRVLLSRETVVDDELDGYRIWAGIDSIE